MRRGFAIMVGLLVISLAHGEAAKQHKQGTYQGEGVVQLVNAKEEILVVEHGQIEGFADAMTMSYQVRSPNLLKGLEQGNRIKFKIDAATEEIIEISRVELMAQSDQPRQQESKISKPAVQLPNPRVTRGVLATEVIDREPEETSSPIPAQVGRLYYFTEVVEAGPPREILHVWTWQDRNVSEIPLRVKGSRFRTWSYKTIPPSWIGQWRVEARTPDGAVLSSETFLVEATMEPISPKGTEEPTMQPSSAR